LSKQPVLNKYKTILKPAEGLYKEKGSKFISIAFPIFSEEDFKQKLSNLKAEYHDARHHCYAYRLGVTSVLERFNDDGEPSGTAGKPILGQIHSFELTNVGIVVVRYFGGIKLGVGGLITAYKQAAADALNNAEIIIRELKDEYQITLGYEDFGGFMSLLKKLNIEHYDIKMEQNCSLKIALPHGDKSFFNELGKIKTEIKFIKTF
jgi:uncharacterized YigZ family protein